MNAIPYALIILSFIYCDQPAPASAASRIQPAIKKICLTIDDGPLGSMGAILDTLKKNDCHAVFYVVGELLENKDSRELAKRAVCEGHLLGNHSYSHPMFSQISLERAKAEIDKTDKLIESIYAEAGKDRPARLFRFPGGDYGGPRKKQLSDYLESLCYIAQYWDIDSNDWRYYAKPSLSKSQIIANCLQVKTGDVILVHDCPMTAEDIIPLFMDHGKYSLTLP